jgi:hypothetical protein
MRNLNVGAGNIIAEPTAIMGIDPAAQPKQ